MYLLIEFQSTIDRFMAVRVLVYLGLLYQDVIDSGQLTQRGRLPPVLPIVLYNGEPRWTAAEDIVDLIEIVPGGLERYRPHLRYLLLDEGRYREEELRPLKNLVTAVFRLENSRTPDDILKVLTALLNWLTEPAQDGFAKTVVNLPSIWSRQTSLTTSARQSPTTLASLPPMQTFSLSSSGKLLVTTKQSLQCKGGGRRRSATGFMSFLGFARSSMSSTVRSSRPHQ